MSSDLCFTHITIFKHNQAQFSHALTFISGKSTSGFLGTSGAGAMGLALVVPGLEKELLVKIVSVLACRRTDGGLGFPGAPAGLAECWVRVSAVESKPSASDRYVSASSRVVDVLDNAVSGRGFGV